jgi:hypothetical protein
MYSSLIVRQIVCHFRIPAGPQVDKPKHSKAHKIDFCGLFCFFTQFKKASISQMPGEQFGSSDSKKHLLTRSRRRGSISSISISEHFPDHNVFCIYYLNVSIFYRNCFVGPPLLQDEDNITVQSATKVIARLINRPANIKNENMNTKAQ